MSARLDGSEILNPGLLRHQIIWQRKNVTGQNSTGEDVFTWQDYLTCRAQVAAASGTEYAREMQTWPEAKFILTQHFSRGISEDMRIAWYVDGDVKYLDVLNIDDPAGTGRYQEVVCRTYSGVGFTA